jgi:hypothetical protein
LARGERISGSAAALGIDEKMGKKKVSIRRLIDNVGASSKLSTLQLKTKRKFQAISHYMRRADKFYKKAFLRAQLSRLPVGESRSIVRQTVAIWRLTISHWTDAADGCIHTMRSRRDAQDTMFRFHNHKNKQES